MLLEAKKYVRRVILEYIAGNVPFSWLFVNLKSVTYTQFDNSGGNVPVRLLYDALILPIALPQALH